MGELQKKEEEMRQMFVQRVKEKEAELKEAEKEVQILLNHFYILYLEHETDFKLERNFSFAYVEYICFGVFCVYYPHTKDQKCLYSK